MTRMQETRATACLERGQKVNVRGADGHLTPATVTSTANGLVWVLLPDAWRPIPIPRSAIEAAG